MLRLFVIGACTIALVAAQTGYQPYPSSQQAYPQTGSGQGYSGGSQGSGQGYSGGSQGSGQGYSSGSGQGYSGGSQGTQGRTYSSGSYAPAQGTGQGYPTYPQQPSGTAQGQVGSPATGTAQVLYGSRPASAAGAVARPAGNPVAPPAGSSFGTQQAGSPAAAMGGTARVGVAAPAPAPAANVSIPPPVPNGQWVMKTGCTCFCFNKQNLQDPPAWDSNAPQKCTKPQPVYPNGDPNSPPPRGGSIFTDPVFLGGPALWDADACKAYPAGSPYQQDIKFFCTCCCPKQQPTIQCPVAAPAAAAGLTSGNSRSPVSRPDDDDS